MFGIYRKKGNLFLFYPLRGDITFLQSFLNNFAWLSAFSAYNIGCKHSLHLENGL